MATAKPSEDKPVAVEGVTVQTADGEKRAPVPVTVLSGFLGASPLRGRDARSDAATHDAAGAQARARRRC